MLQNTDKEMASSDLDNDDSGSLDSISRLDVIKSDDLQSKEIGLSEEGIPDLLHETVGRQNVRLTDFGSTP